MVSEARTAGPPLPPRPLPRPSLPPHSARSIGHPRKFPGTQGMVADRLAGIMKNASACQNATGTIKSTTGRESSARNKENCAIPLETAVELLGIKKEEEEGAQGVKEYRVGEACIERPRHPLPKTPTRIGEINGAQLLRGGILDFENQQSEPLGLMIASTVHGSWDISANGLIGLHALQSLPLCSGRTYNTITRIRSGKYRGDAPCESHPLPALPAQKKTKPTPDDVGYVINSNTEYLEAVAKQYSQSFGKMGKVFIKVHGIDGLNLPKKCTGMHHEGIAADQYVYIVMECDGQNFSSRRVAADPGRIRVGEEFAFSVRAGCNLTVKLAVALPTKGMITGSTSFYPTVGTNQQPDSKASGEFSSSSSTQNLSSEIGSSGYSIPRMESSGSSIFSTGESVAQICLQLDESALSHLSIPKSTAGFQQSWDLLGKYFVPQEHVKPSPYERKATSHSLKRQWQKLKKHSMMSGSTGVSTLNDMTDDASVSQSHLVVVGNIKVSVVVWPYSGDWTPSGFDECVRILTCDGVLNLNHLIKEWTEHGNEYIARNPKVKLTSILEAGSVLGNMMVLGNASVRVAGSLFWKRRSFAIHPPHLLSLPISDQLPTHVHQAFDLRLCRVEAPFDTPIQDIQDGLWHPTANAFRICFRKSVMNFKEEETVELSVDRLTTAKEWVNLLREIVGRLQSMEF